MKNLLACIGVSLVCTIFVSANAPAIVAQNADESTIMANRDLRPISLRHKTEVQNGKDGATTIAVQPKKRVTPLFPALDHSGISAHHKAILSELIYTIMPEHCRNVLTTIRVLYQGAKYRGLAGQHTVIMDGTLSDQEFRAVAIHELGHVIDMGCHQGNTNAAATKFMDGSRIVYANDLSVSYYQISWQTDTATKAATKPVDFFSGYARSNPFEDFAEHFAAYILQRDLFARLAKRNTALAQKYTWMDTTFGHLPAVAKGRHIWSNQPWDTTVLRYKWIGEEAPVVAIK